MRLLALGVYYVCNALAAVVVFIVTAVCFVLTFPIVIIGIVFGRLYRVGELHAVYGGDEVARLRAEWKDR